MDNSIPPGFGKHRLRVRAAEVAFALSLLAGGAWMLFRALSPAYAGPAPGPLAQTGSPSFGAPTFFGEGLNGWKVVMADLNDDGALDLVVANRNPHVTYLYLNRNDGTGAFAAPAALPGSLDTSRAAVGDVNGDGAPDLVLGNYSGTQMDVYLNQLDSQGRATGAFAPTVSLGSSQGDGIALGDLNGDGALDLVLGNNGSGNQVYLNPGDGSFNRYDILPNSENVDSYRVSMGDLNDDGALDLVVANQGQPSQVYLNPNDGTGTFGSPADIPGSGLDTRGAALGDLDGDGALDLVLSTYNVSQSSQVYLNPGNGVFTNTAGHYYELPPGGGGRSLAALPGDLNGDGTLDLVITNDASAGRGSQVYLNDGTGVFTTTAGLYVELPFSTINTADGALGDLNGDGRLDLVLVQHGQPNLALLNTTPLTFPDPTDLPVSDQATSAAVGDLNGDGVLDLVLGVYDKPSQVYLNPGSGIFTSTGALYQTLPVSRKTRSVAIGDLDGDGDLDLALGNDAEPSQVYLNPGDGVFSASVELPGSGRPTASIGTGDVDSDGDLDLVLGNDWILLDSTALPPQPSQVYLNNGDGSFAPPTDLPASGRRSLGVGMGDFNGDGALDVALANGQEIAQVYLNDGAGGFGAPIDLPNSAQNNSSLAVGDLNGDGALDIVLGNENRPSQIYPNKNDGSGRFAAPIALPGASFLTKNVALGDLNGDGALDIVIVNRASSGPNQYYLNDGAGNFGAPNVFPSGARDTWGLALGDVNGDGALDVLLGNYAQPGQVYLSRATRANRLPNNPPAIAIVRPGPAPDANFYSAPSVLISPTIPVAYTLSDREGDPVGFVRAFYSPDGGGTWQDAVPAGTPTTNLAASPDGAPHTFIWDTFASGFFGQSDNVVFRIQAYPGYTPTIGNTAGPYQRTYTSATSFPFRVRGTQVRVLSDTLPAANAIVYRLPGTQTVGATPLGRAGRPFRTDGRGYLQGRGEIRPGDRLVALLPLASAEDIKTTHRTDVSQTIPVTEVLRPASVIVTSTLIVADGGVISDVNVVNLQGTHTWLSDLSFALESPQGTRVEIMAPSCGDSDDFNLSLDDEASPGPWPCPPTDGNAYQPSNPLSVFDGESIAGAWALVVTDYFPSLDGGSLDGWGLEILTTDITTTVIYSSTDVPQVIPEIPDSGVPIVTVTSTLIVTDDAVIRDVNVVDLQGTHTWLSDLSFALESPQGTRVEIMAPSCGDLDDFNLSLDDEAPPGSWPCPPIDGSAYQPSNPLSAFDGENSEGAWTLIVTDYYPSADGGSLKGWGLEITGDAAPYLLYYTSATPTLTGLHMYTVTTGDVQTYASADVPQPIPEEGTATSQLTVTGGGVIRDVNVVNLNGTHTWMSDLSFTLQSPQGTQVEIMAPSCGDSHDFNLSLDDEAPPGPWPCPPTDGNVYQPSSPLSAFDDEDSSGTWTLSITDHAPGDGGSLDGWGLEITASTGAGTPSGGVQTLTVSSANPLILFNLDISLEWDARKDTQYLDQLRFNLLRASELLYDWTNGQAALGRVNVYQAKERWNTADVSIYASNQVRPMASQGGIVGDALADPVTSTVVYEPGQVHIGATWNRFGDAGGNLSEDWPRALAHELGHYALYLDDAYLGWDDQGFLIPVETCIDTAMADPYRDDYSEFHYETSWHMSGAERNCEDTLGNKSTGRWDWATIKTFYPWLNDSLTNPGPSALPLAVTQITFVEPAAPATAVEVPLFHLIQAGAVVQPGADARAFLFQDDSLVDLGRPTLDQVLARGARPGDRVCVYEMDARRLGCKTVSQGDEQLELVSKPDWRPEIIVSPVTSTTIDIQVKGLPDTLPAKAVLYARLFPLDGSPPTTIMLSPVPPQVIYLPLILRSQTGSSAPSVSAASDTASTPLSLGGYAGRFDLAEPALEGYVQVWIEEVGQRRETVTDYSIGGNPVRKRGRPVRKRGRPAPVASSDGQVIVFGTNLNFGEGEFYTLQAATALPSAPAWATVVGRAYRLSASDNAPSLQGASISFDYLGSQAPPGEEPGLRVYYLQGTSWRPLRTFLDTYHNHAAAPVQGPGLYALMSSVEIPLSGPGWNPFGYPVQGSRPVTQALLSISGYYTTVYGTVLTDTLDPWKVYDVTTPDWVDDLTHLEFGRTYWINVSQAITLQVTGGGAAALSVEGLPSPPTTFYGPVLPGLSFTPAAGMVVTAWIDGHACGQGKTRLVDGQVMYTLNVFAEGPGGAPGCGAPGRSITFKVGSTAMSAIAAWNIDRVWYLPLGPSYFP